MATASPGTASLPIQPTQNLFAQALPVYHCCQYCEGIKLGLIEPSEEGEIILSQTYSEVERAANQGCPLYHWLKWQIPKVFIESYGQRLPLPEALKVLLYYRYDSASIHCWYDEDIPKVQTLGEFTITAEEGNYLLLLHLSYR
jgi:hypothetical protein